ncbi:MAG: NTP transferase domain-containing protein [Muribaculaceae bacterium]|nr:NTP transferase domain-containing protein [Muribaculaceae bacterium]
MKNTDTEISPETKKIIERHSISPDKTIRDAMRKINGISGESMTLFVINDSGKILGSITDGDIRRALIVGGDLQDCVSTVMNKNFLSVKSSDNIPLVMAEGRKKHIELLPVINNGKIEELIDLRITHTCLPLEAVLMAGGRGERLRPLTDEMPKPLLPVAGKPIIDYNVEELEACGIKKIHVTVNYMGDKIRNHFAERRGRAKVDCITEPKRLGTFGSLAFVENISTDDIIVMNSDLLSVIDFESMYLHHRRSGADFTIGAVPYSVSVPFAIMRLQGHKVKSLEEKPTYNYFANGGVYIMKSNLISRINKGEYLDAPDFIMTLIKDNFNVSSYHINGTWVDIGSPDDYRLANELASRKIK